MAHIIRRTVVAGTIAVACAALAGGAFAQSYPSKPIKIIVPTAAGGGNDFIARVVAQKLEESLK